MATAILGGLLVMIVQLEGAGRRGYATRQVRAEDERNARLALDQMVSRLREARVGLAVSPAAVPELPAELPRRDANGAPQFDPSGAVQLELARYKLLADGRFVEERNGQQRPLAFLGPGGRVSFRLESPNVLEMTVTASRERERRSGRDEVVRQARFFLPNQGP